MKGLIIGILIGIMLSAPSVMALRIEKPHEFSQWDNGSFSQLNSFLLGVWNVINGKYQMDITTTDPDGSRSGNKGEFILYDPGAAEELCVNIDGSSDWDCASLT